MSIKNVYHEITSFENLLRADKNCASQHTDKWEIIEFRRNLEENLLNLRDRLRRLDIPPVRYRSFLVFDPKVRKVIYTDYTTKVIQRAIYDVLYEPIQRGFITDTYAYCPLPLNSRNHEASLLTASCCPLSVTHAYVSVMNPL